ncbi:phosphoadenosine phosphosulfate reductase [Profundibacter sp.]
MATVNKSAIAGSSEAWKNTLTRAGAEDGFYREVGPQHKAVFIRKGPVLVVSFDNLDDIRQKSDRLPWGVEFVTSKGWSTLGLLAHGPTWYRDEAVFDFFESLAKDGFFKQFEKVVFYGTSMGGYAACAFSAVVPGSTVIAVNPQATLNREVASWEQRFRPAWRKDFNSRYGFAPDMIETAERVFLFYNPTLTADAMHAALFRGPQVTKIKCRYMGHGILSVWQNMGVLGKIVTGCVEGTLDRVGIYKLLRARKHSTLYQKMLLNHLVANKRHALTITYCNAITAKQFRPHFRNARQNALQALKSQSAAPVARKAAKPIPDASNPPSAATT